MEFIELLKERNIRFEIKENRLIVFSNVFLRNTPIKELPDCPMTFFGDVNLSYTQIKKLPKCSMIFNGNLNISHTQIKELLDNIIVKSYLGINGTSITKISKDLIAYRICTPVKSKFLIYIQKDGKIGINRLEKSIVKWIDIFKERKFFDYYRILTPEEYDLVEQDFKTAEKLYESWNS